MGRPVLSGRDGSDAQLSYSGFFATWTAAMPPV